MCNDLEEKLNDVVDKPSAICNWETSGYITLS